MKEEIEDKNYYIDAIDYSVKVLRKQAITKDLIKKFQLEKSKSNKREIKAESKGLTV